MPAIQHPVYTRGGAATTTPTYGDQNPEALFSDHFSLFQILEQAPLAIILTDGEARIQYINARAVNTFGYTFDELQGEKIEILLPEQFRNAHPRQRQHFTQEPHQRPMGIGLDLSARKKNGEIFPVEVGLSHVQLPDGLHIICYISDISQRKEIEKQLVSSEARFRNLIDAAPDAVILLDQQGRVVQINKTGERVFGYNQAELAGKSIETVIPAAHRQEHLEHRREYTANPSLQKMGVGSQAEALRKDGSTFQVEIALSPISLEGESMLIAIVRDITERIQMESQLTLLAQIVQQMKDAVILTDSDHESKIRYVNKAFTDLYGYTEEEVLGKSSWILFAGEAAAREAIERKRDLHIQQQKEFRGEYQDRKKDGSHFWVSNTSSMIQLGTGEQHYDLGIVRDVSEQVQYQQLLSKQNAFLGALHETSLDILSRLDLTKVLESLTGQAASILDCGHGLVYLMDPTRGELVCPVGLGSFKSLVGSRLQKGRGLIGLIWETDETQICIAPQVEMDCPGYTIPEEIRSVIGVPLRSGGEFIGVLCVANDHQSNHHFGADEIEMLTYFGELASIAIQNATLFSETERALQVTEHQKARMDRELDIARSVQRALLPHALPQLPDWSFAALWKPALEVAGDFYDVIVREDGYFDVLIADVTDKGVPAALFMAYSKSILNLTMGTTPSLLEGITLANRLLHQKDVGLFVTMFAARIHAESGKMVYVSAGHPPVLVYRSATDQVQELSNTGIPLGIDPDMAYEQRTLQLAPDDFLVLYTDGITEAMDQCNDMFGENRLEEAIYGQRHGTVDEIANGLIGEVNSFISLSHPSDDIAILVVKRQP